MLPGMIGIGARGLGLPEADFWVGQTSVLSSATSHLHGPFYIGPEDNDRWVIGAAMARTAGGITTVTVGGVSATIFASSANAMVWFRANIPSGTSVGVTVSGANMFGSNVSLWQTKELVSTTEDAAAIYTYSHDTDTSDAQSITPVAGGFILAAGISGNTITANAGSTDWTSTLGTIEELYDQNLEDYLNNASAAHILGAAGTSHTITRDHNIDNGSNNMKWGLCAFH